jgi:asparagine synthetase B (glutamine-hydrolysing)
MIDFHIEINRSREIRSLNNMFIIKPSVSLSLTNSEVEFLAWGDPIYDEKFTERFLKKPDIMFIINNLYGHYYYLLLNKINSILFAGNSLFSILPVYYKEKGPNLWLSDNPLMLKGAGEAIRFNKRFILENILFNYPLFNQSIIEGVNLLPSNSYFNVSNTSISILKHTNIEDSFSLSPRPWRKSVIEMRDVFLETVKKYLPDKPYAQALTGGFDGRTLVSAGLFYKKKFSCYSFGSSSSQDIQIASQLTAKAGIPFIDIQLNNEYAAENSLNCGIEFIRQSSGTASFARAHYLFAAKRLAVKTEYMITGNFGSEIFRAAHVPGVMIAPNLFALYKTNAPEEGFRSIINSTEFGIMKSGCFKKEWDNLKEDLLRLPCYNPEYKNLTQNQRFYIFVFEEIFRKYFGAEMVNQFGYLKNRTPFLDIDFMKTIFTTGLAGIHSVFFEHNLLKRFKGQVLYAHIIKKAYPVFGSLMTDKGYKPDDLLTLHGKLDIIKGYFKRISGNNLHNIDPFGVSKAWETNQDYWRSIPISPEYFNLLEINKKEFKLDRELLYRIISLSHLIRENHLPPVHQSTK